MFKAAIRVNKITSIAQLRGATLHAERGDETSQARLREGAEPGAGLAWSKAAESDRDYLAAFKAHKAELGAGERKGAPLCMQALCVVSPEWIKAAGDLHDPDNPRNRALFGVEYRGVQDRTLRPFGHDFGHLYSPVRRICAHPRGEVCARRSAGLSNPSLFRWLTAWPRCLVFQ